ncbi:PilN domain-containing protein [Vulgatibacter sp.]|uniref:PilN domain-containing protein n=1 Tax=Vulgatibacter sp. TaxID=1971226 RepID=UPI003563938D
MIRINLLPVRQAKKKEAGQKQLAILAGCVLAVLGGNYFWYSSLDSTLTEKKQAVTKLQAEIKQLDQIIGEITNIKKDQADLEAKLAVLDRLRKGRTGPVKMLDALATLMPDRVWLREVDEKGGTLTLRGAAITNEDLADFMRELKKNAFFKEPSLKRASQVDDRDAGSRVIQFELSCAINYSA